MSHDSAPDSSTRGNAPAPLPAGCIVVGHDGSTGADEALDVALGLAEKIPAPVVVVRSWSIATAPRPATWEFGYVSSFDEYSQAAHDALVSDTQAALATHPTVQVSFRAMHTSPARSLIELSRDSRMLVVGSRGLGGLTGMLLGSVSEQCSRHAHAPVLIVRPRD